MDTQAQIANDDEDPTEVRCCQACGDDYEPYAIFLEDNFVTISEWVNLRERYDHLCRTCLNDKMETGNYALEDRPNDV